MSGAMRRVGAILYRQFILMRHDPTRLTPIVIWVVVDMTTWGFITRFLNGNAHGLNFVPLFLGAVLLWDFLVRAIMGVVTGYMEDSWSRNFLNLFAAPVSAVEYLVGLVSIGIMTSLIGLAVMIALAGGVFELHLLDYGIALLPISIILLLFGTAVGIFGCGLMLRLGPAAEWFVWPMPAVLSPFVGVFYPLAVLPVWMRAIAKILPPSYVFENIRRIAAGQPPVWSGLAIGLCLSIFYTLLAGVFFTRIHRYALRNGLISRFAAESF